jgi:hypothetical protein
MIVLWAVLTAVLFVLISPFTPGVFAPQGGKLLKPYVTLALFAHVLAHLLSIARRVSYVPLRDLDVAPQAARNLPLSLRC